jgi:hypothetical protein
MGISPGEISASGAARYADRSSAVSALNQSASLFGELFSVVTKA